MGSGRHDDVTGEAKSKFPTLASEGFAMMQKLLHGWARRTAALAASVVLALATAVVIAPSAQAEIDVYSAPGTYFVNGREWKTTCEPYSQTMRCRTNIWSTQVKQVRGKFVSRTGWNFNNLSYLSSPRSLWTKNPLASYGKYGATTRWTASDGRLWRTECDTAVSGRNGCRSYVTSRVIEAYRTSNGATAYRWVTKQVFNNIVRFGPLPVFKNVAMNTTVSLKYFDVTVSNPIGNRDGTDFGAKVKVCYTHVHPDAGSDGKVRVSRDPWSFGILAPEIRTDLAYAEVDEFPSSKLWTPLFSETRLALGACQTGYISAAHGNPDMYIETLRYAPAGSADRITWYIPS